MTRVLPTRVGMVRRTHGGRAMSACSPHPRGDGPLLLDAEIVVRVFSPPAWGWSAGLVRLTLFDAVLPTRVGMVRSAHQ